MSAPSIIMPLRSLLTMIAAMAVLVAGIGLSGEIATRLGLPAGGEFRLAWDLGGIVMPAWLAFVIAARLAPFAPRRHVSALLSMLMAAALWIVWRMGTDYPGWFNAGLLLSLPAAAWLVLRRLDTVGKRGA